MSQAAEKYVSGDYGVIHEGWHIADAPGKADDLMPAMSALAAKFGKRPCHVADVGTGVAGVPAELLKRIGPALPGFDLRITGYEIAERPAMEARRLFPHITVLNCFFDESAPRYDAVMFNDVLEHLENPLGMMQLASDKADHMIVRQPLLDNFKIFRDDAYEEQRRTLGHIAYFNCRSFENMARSAGWKPMFVENRAPWEVSGPGGRAGGHARWLKKLMTRIDRTTTSFLLNGFHVVGVFERA